MRPAPAGSAELVAIQHAAKAKGPWTTVKTLTVKSTTGQFLTRTKKRPGVWRLALDAGVGGKAKTSRIAQAASG